MAIQDLVERYRVGRTAFQRPNYNETQLRNDFINPLLRSFGWDVDNTKQKTQPLRDVILEEYIVVEGETSKKNPDYTLRINGTKKLFVEVKKPHVDILQSPRSAFQIRRYGWSANLGISILTNFEHLIIYDCRFKPEPTDSERVARIHTFHFEEYAARYEEIKALISFESANAGHLDNVTTIRGQTFDDYFLTQIEGWRTKLAVAALEENEDLDADAVNFLVQRLLNRIIFLRICEDRTIQSFETLKNIQSYDALKQLFRASDRKFNSGLFDFIEDTLSFDIDIDSTMLVEIFKELYYPLSPYDFSVVDPLILSQIYERFLGNRIIIDDQDGERKISILAEPEVAASAGVVPTPKIIVEQIVKDTLTPVTLNKSLAELSSFKVADICCGSGTFLISVYDFLLNKTLEKILEEDPNNQALVYEMTDNVKVLTLKAKRDILKQNIFGVDINPYATEVTEFNLLLKLLEGENHATVNSFISQYAGEKVLPNLENNIKCGNSLVGSTFYEFMPSALENIQLLFKVNPFDWHEEFPFLNETGGFDAIVGNPPYVRIQNLVKYTPEEINYYQSSNFGYTVAKQDTVDKYYIFIERALSLLNQNGFLGYIVTHKFFLIEGGKSLRKLITDTYQISKITHFGVTQVFPNVATYTAILILQRESKDTFQFKRLNKITPESLEEEEGFIECETAQYRSDPWIFLSPDTYTVFNKIRSLPVAPLGALADICVGLQTSADKIYIFTPEEETENTYVFTKNNRSWQVEKNICRPAIYKLKMQSFDKIEANSQLIFPYIIEDSLAKIFNEEYFENNFPLTWAYLSHHRQQLSRRSLQGTNPKWYEFGRSQSLTRFHDAPKIIWPVLSTKPSYAYDNNNLQFTGGGNGPYYALINSSQEYSLLYFLGILSHPLFENMVKVGASEFRGAYYSHGKQFIENLPVRLIDFNDPIESEPYHVIIRLVKSLLHFNFLYKNAYGSNREQILRRIKTYERALIFRINYLYQISDEEFDLVMSDEMLKTELATEE